MSSQSSLQSGGQVISYSTAGESAETVGGQADLTAATLIAHGLQHQLNGPNVIVEQMPYGGGEGVGAEGAHQQQSVFDQVGDIERQFSSMVQLPEPELVEYDVYFDYAW